MDERGRRESETVAETTPRDDGAVRIHESRPGRLVFTEEGNTDGWIATDLVLEAER